ncbi:MAG: hypothetical protein IPK82_04790 [Polyangiaceae bacterium]|nr:hypothetical protein [Polyangiaceae bacterium]
MAGSAVLCTQAHSLVFSRSLVYTPRKPRRLCTQRSFSSADETKHEKPRCLCSSAFRP